MVAVSAVLVVLVMAISAVAGVALMPHSSAGPSTSSGAALAAAASSSPTPIPAAAPKALHVSAGVQPAAATHGDLYVAAGTTVTIAPLVGEQTYYQGGNITVAAGGTLIVKNTTLSFVQYVASGGNLANQLSSIYRFVDAGNVQFYNSSLTSDPVPLNAVPKLFVNITGAWTAWNSTFDFPGWIVDHGATGDASFFQSNFQQNDQIVQGSRDEPFTVYNDTIWSPALNVTGGATLNLFGTNYLDTYANDYFLSGFPNSQALSTTGFIWLNDTGARDVTNDLFSLPPGTTPTELVQDMLYPAQASAITVGADYDNSGATTVNADVSVLYDGGSYPIGTISFPVGTGVATLTTTPDAPILAAMYEDGSPFYLSGGVDFTSVSVPIGSLFVNITTLSLTMTPRLDYDLSASGAGTQLNAVNSLLDLNWTTPVSGSPWLSAKLDITTGATADLANVSVSQLPYFDGTTGQTSAIAVGPGSVANFYRWAAMNFTGGPDGILGVYNTSITAAYAYGLNQTNNATANALYGALTAAGSPIYGYTKYLAAQAGQLGYGVSGPLGSVGILLPASQLTTASDPDGVYLGDWHVAVKTPFSASDPYWFYGSVLPYPQGVANGTAGYGSPDYWTPIYFPQYNVVPSIGPIVVTANGSATVNNTVRIGQVVGVNVTFSNLGAAPVYSLSGDFSYSNKTTSALSSIKAEHLAIASGGAYVAGFTWFVNDSNSSLDVDHGMPFTQAFFGGFMWVGSPAGAKVQYIGFNYFYVNITILPSEVRIVSATVPPSTVDLNTQYVTTGNIRYNGSYPAGIFLYAVPKGSVTPITLGSGTSLPGVWSISWRSPLSDVLSQGTTYTFEVVASYNGVTTTYIVGTFSTPAPPPNPLGIFGETFLGLPLWVWLAIAAAIAVGAFVFLFFVRRQAAGRLVECGECGNLIPEDATVCPKCGAEFEHDLIRCSRCASTIPADSKVCPECAAQLLGKPGEAGTDPEVQGYNDFTEKYRAEGKRELGDNYSEGAFWDWWKRQPTYTSFSQWKLQQGTGTSRVGMTAPPAAAAGAAAAMGPGTPPGGAGGSAVPPPASPSAAPTSAPPAAPPPSGAVPVAAAAAAGGAAVPTAVPAAGGTLKKCPSCGKEIPAEYIVCPFCNAVTQ